ncbi:FabD/lysophospholipase-like protein [Aureobasidium namibiae CBS 147.97]|uniref:FabD/lysophospholipase-like protein n=1 Tax=Aureobasidium namibiae CBS 147.97 TaxID=1043004 RepID=A0A074XIY3_9PEZI|nr:FabD/lysophospholipase-like protein [Aureobasidium namibiae CBS 147.97]KEQ74516.1 FabD/lysophospholipase-like protein [Aureobasidium namibiae CBS 147.97]
MFGTSTGGIIAIMLGRLRMSIKDCISTYSSLGGEVFGKKQPFYLLGQNKYDCTKLERIIRDVAKSNSRNPKNDPLMADTSVLNRSHQPREQRVQNRCIPCRVGVFAVQSDADMKVHMFRSYFNRTPPSANALDDLTISLHRQPRDIPIWKIARATSAAPSYFKSMKVDGLRLMDGGLLANNPSQLARNEVISMHRYHPSGSCKPPTGETSGNGADGIRFLVSLGTGKQANQHITRNLLSVVKFALKQMTNPEVVHKNLQDSLDPRMYYRFNVEEGLKKMNLDEWIVKGENNVTLSKMKDAVSDYFDDGVVRDRARALARELVEHRRARRIPGHEWFRNLTVSSGLPPSPIDDRYRSEDNGLPNGITNGIPSGDRRVSLPEPLHGAVELHTPVPESLTGRMTPELAPGSPIQNSTQSLPTSPTTRPYDSAMPLQGEWSGSSPQA